MPLPGPAFSRRLLLGALGTAPLLRPARAAPVHRLTLLHVNDFHSRHDPVDGRAMTCTAGPACFGGSPRLATAIREQRAAAQADGRTVMLLDAGDEFQGSLFFTAHHGMAELAMQHEVGVDAMALGNHEFDDGPETLGHYVRAARFPILSANIDVADEPALAGLVQPWTLLERDGIRLGVVGLTTLETRTSSSPGPRIRFLPPGPALLQAATAARGAGAVAVVALSHLGLPLDLGLEGVAAVIGGHTHTLLSNTEAGAAGPAPIVSGNGPLVVQTGAYGRYLGRLDLDLAPDGTVLAHAATCRHIGLDLVPDPAMAAIVDRYAAPLEELRRRPVATLAEALGVDGCRVMQCPFGLRVADAIRAAAHPGSPAAPGTEGTIGLMNAGGLRAGLPAGPVSLGQVLDAMPFGNTLATVTVSGAVLQEAVRHGLSMTGRGGYAQWAGLRLQGLTIEVERAGQWRPLDRAARYLLATNDFIRNGGDGYTMLRDGGADAYDAGPGIAELFAQALARAGR